ncbi:unnamed protein product [Laminaria digitata]
MRLGGQALLVALHQGVGFPGAAAVYEKIRERSMKFVPCASADEACIRQALRSNLERILPLFEGMKRIFILQMDEIACEERARRQ